MCVCDVRVERAEENPYTLSDNDKCAKMKFEREWVWRVLPNKPQMIETKIGIETIYFAVDAASN